MYKVFIADDEYMVIKSLKASVEWKEYGYEVIGEACNGIEAYESIMKLKPDIVFTDIRMPGLNGLELIKKVGEMYSNILFVVISGYAEFAYAQKALNYGALGFCLKPFDDLEIVNILKKAQGVINKVRASFETELLSLLEDSSYDEDRKKRQVLESLGFDCSGENGIFALVTSGTGRLNIPENYKNIHFKMGKNRNIYLLQGKLSLIESIRNDLPQGINCVGISSICYSTDLINDIITEASIAADQYFMTGEKSIYEYREVDCEDLNNLLAQLESVIMKRDIPSIQGTLDLIEDEFSKGIYNIKNAFQVYNIVVHSYHVADPHKYELYIFDYEELKSLFSNAKGMMAYLKRLIIACPLLKVEQASSEVTNETFRNILKYINDNYCDDISLQSISRIFTVNPSYVSQLFKKQTGVTFTEYLTELRVNYASGLLKNSCLAVNEIAEKAGFNDYYYFTKVFKKATGRTPTRYRDNYCEV